MHVPLDLDQLREAVLEVGIGEPTVVTSRAISREEYLRRPDLGRLPADSMTVLDTPADIGFMYITIDIYDTLSFISIKRGVLVGYPSAYTC